MIGYPKFFLWATVAFVFVYEHDTVMLITRLKQNVSGLWALGPIVMASVTEILLSVSVFCTYLRYADIVERLQVYLNILRKYNITVCRYSQ